MSKKTTMKLAALGFFVLLALSSVSAQGPQGSSPENNPAPPGDKPAKKTTKLHVVVKGGEDSKPIAAAQVDVTSQEEGVNFSAQVHTDATGGADLVVPRGKVLIQVIAAHFPVAGAAPTLQGEKQTVEIKLSAQTANND